jgi:hypothetical protein
VKNCETLLFQRPDDAIHRGFDKDAEADLASPGTFISNFEPLDVDRRGPRRSCRRIRSVHRADEAADRRFRRERLHPKPGTWFPRASAHRGRQPFEEPALSAEAPDLANPRDSYLAEIGTRLAREIPSASPSLPCQRRARGRRNNPPDPKAGIPPLAVYSPIHYQELPELFMDFICSLTGKSPSTTGFGSEGALTKGPFNALRRWST